MRKLENMLLKNQQANDIIEEEIRKYLKKMKHTFKSAVCSKSSSKKEVYSNTVLPQEIRKISNYLKEHLNQNQKMKKK